jgi:hypothetical protein
MGTGIAAGAGDSGSVVTEPTGSASIAGGGSGDGCGCEKRRGDGEKRPWGGGVGGAEGGTGRLGWTGGGGGSSSSSALLDSSIELA